MADGKQARGDLPRTTKRRKRPYRRRQSKKLEGGHGEILQNLRACGGMEIRRFVSYVGETKWIQIEAGPHPDARL